MDKVAHKQSKVLTKCGRWYDAKTVRPVVASQIRDTERELVLSMTELRKAELDAKKQAAGKAGQP